MRRGGHQGMLNRRINHMAWANPTPQNLTRPAKPWMPCIPPEIMNAHPWPPDISSLQSHDAEEMITSENIEFGYKEPILVANEYGSLKRKIQPETFKNEVDRALNVLFWTKAQINLEPSNVRSKPTLPALLTNKDQRERSNWMKALAQPQVKLQDITSIFHFKIDVLIKSLAEYEVPFVRAAWIVKVHYYHTSSSSSVQRTDKNEEWTKALVKEFCVSSESLYLKKSGDAARTRKCILYIVRLFQWTYRDGLVSLKTVIECVLDRMKVYSTYPDQDSTAKLQCLLMSLIVLYLPDLMLCPIHLNEVIESLSSIFVHISSFSAVQNFSRSDPFQTKLHSLLTLVLKTLVVYVPRYMSALKSRINPLYEMLLGAKSGSSPVHSLSKFPDALTKEVFFSHTDLRVYKWAIAVEMLYQENLMLSSRRYLKKEAVNGHISPTSFFSNVLQKLNTCLQGPDMDELFKSSFQSAEIRDFRVSVPRLVSLLFQWVVNAYALTHYRIYICTSLLKMYVASTEEEDCLEMIQDCMISFLDNSASLPLTPETVRKVSILCDDMIRLGLFSYSQYLCNLNARSILDKSFFSEKKKRHLTLLRHIPVLRSYGYEKDQRQKALSQQQPDANPEEDIRSSEQLVDRLIEQILKQTKSGYSELCEHLSRLDTYSQFEVGECFLKRAEEALYSEASINRIEQAEMLVLHVYFVLEKIENFRSLLQFMLNLLRSDVCMPILLGHVLPYVSKYKYMIWAGNTVTDFLQALWSKRASQGENRAIVHTMERLISKFGRAERVSSFLIRQNVPKLEKLNLSDLFPKAGPNGEIQAAANVLVDWQNQNFDPNAIESVAVRLKPYVYRLETFSELVSFDVINLLKTPAGTGASETRCRALALLIHALCFQVGVSVSAMSNWIKCAARQAMKRALDMWWSSKGDQSHSEASRRAFSVWLLELITQHVITTRKLLSVIATVASECISSIESGEAGLAKFFIDILSTIEGRTDIFGWTPSDLRRSAFETSLPICRHTVSIDLCDSLPFSTVGPLVEVLRVSLSQMAVKNREDVTSFRDSFITKSLAVFSAEKLSSIFCFPGRLESSIDLYSVFHQTTINTGNIRSGALSSSVVSDEMKQIFGNTSVWNIQMRWLEMHLLVKYCNNLEDEASSSSDNKGEAVGPPAADSKQAAEKPKHPSPSFPRSYVAHQVYAELLLYFVSRVQLTTEDVRDFACVSQTDAIMSAFVQLDQQIRYHVQKYTWKKLRQCQDERLSLRACFFGQSESYPPSIPTDILEERMGYIILQITSACLFYPISTQFCTERLMKLVDDIAAVFPLLHDVDWWKSARLYLWIQILCLRWISNESVQILTKPDPAATFGVRSSTSKSSEVEAMYDKLIILLLKLLAEPMLQTSIVDGKDLWTLLFDTLEYVFRDNDSHFRRILLNMYTTLVLPADLRFLLEQIMPRISRREEPVYRCNSMCGLLPNTGTGVSLDPWLLIESSSTAASLLEQFKARNVAKKQLTYATSIFKVNDPEFDKKRMRIQ